MSPLKTHRALTARALVDWMLAALSDPRRSTEVLEALERSGLPALRRAALLARVHARLERGARRAAA